MYKKFSVAGSIFTPKMKIIFNWFQIFLHGAFLTCILGAPTPKSQSGLYFDDTFASQPEYYYDYIEEEISPNAIQHQNSEVIQQLKYDAG